MATANTKQKPGKSRPAALQKALARRDARSARFIYEDVIQRHAQHLKECRKPGCVECKDARVLIPYYRAGMKKALRGISLHKRDIRLPA